MLQTSEPRTPLRLRDFVQALPKTETHLHIEGALPYSLLHEWNAKKYPASPEFHARTHRFKTFPEFDSVLLGHALPWFTSAERYAQSARRMFTALLAQNVFYVETSFHLPVSGFINVPGREIIAAIRSAVPAGMEVRIFAGMLRTDYTGPMRAIIDDLVNWDELAGVDLHGFEQVPTESWTSEVWARLRAAGKVTKVHAGEFDGAARVEEAIAALGSNRIQHGVRAIEDAAVLRLARERDVTFDVCPISNVRLGVARSLAEHPLRALMAAGIRCTISTDDPLVFGNTLTDEYFALGEEGGFTFSELAQLAKNGWEVADLPLVTKAEYQGEIARVLRQHGTS